MSPSRSNRRVKLPSPAFNRRFNSSRLIFQVWAIADSKRQGFLGFTEFVTAMQLISYAQEHELSPDVLKAEVDWENIKPPVMEGVDALIAARAKISTTNGVAVNGNGITRQPSAEWTSSKSAKRLSLNAVTSIVDGLKRLYIEKLKPLEAAYRFNDFGNPLLTNSDFDAKPMIMLLGQYSTGKTTFIKHLLRCNYPDKSMYSLAQSLVKNKPAAMWESRKSRSDEEGLKTLNISQCTALTGRDSGLQFIRREAKKVYYSFFFPSFIDCDHVS